MKKLHLVFCLFVLFTVSALRSEASEDFWRGKVIFINQLTQDLIAYLNGKEVMRFRIISGDAKLKTPQGIYRVEHKDEKYWSKQYSTLMPYSLFFLWNEINKMAVHQGKVPLTKRETSQKATHGCVHVHDKEDMKLLFDWAEEKTTKIIIYGDRSRN